MNTKFANMIALCDNLTTYHYKVILLLLQKEMTQSQLCKELAVSKQNINKVCKLLEQLGVICVAHIEGNLKYLKLNANIKELQMVGQLKIDE